MFEVLGVISIALIAFMWIGRRKKGSDKAQTAQLPTSTSTRSISTAQPQQAFMNPSGSRREPSIGLEEFRLVPLPDAPPSTATKHGNVPASKAWIPQGAGITIAGIHITDGMIYVASELTVPGRYGPDHCLINPGLPVARRVTPGESLGLSYWPSYSEILPVARRAYLEWLAGGRMDPATDIGLVFLFFYGLERRLFLERQTTDAAILIAEVRRLLGIYGGNHSFRSYASSFLTAATLMSGERPQGLIPHPTHDWSGEIPFATRVHLGFLLHEGGKLGSDDALLWIVGHPETNLRTPGRRCFDELRQLFGIRFAERHPEGLKVRAPKKRMEFNYRAASGTFVIEVAGQHQALPDIAAITAPIAGLRDLVEGCQVDLEAYSRFVGRKPDERETLQAVLLLPAVLQTDAIQKALLPLRSNISALIPDGHVSQITMRALLTALGLVVGSGVSKVPQPIVNAMAQRLDALGFGVEPDRRYGGRTPALDGTIVIFAAPNGGSIDADRPEFVTAKAAIEVAILASIADGHLSTEEFSALTNQARHASGLDDAERARLEAFLWSIRSRASGGSALKRAAVLPEEAKRSIAAAAVAAVLADGVASLREVAFLERIYQTLGMSIESLHSAIHQSSTTISTDRLAGSRRTSVIQQQGASNGAIDPARLERIRAETLEVSALLSDIFSEEAEDDEPNEALRDERVEGSPGSASAFAGLDVPHGKLLAMVISAQPMSVSDFGQHARGLHLLPEGAMETINDWGFDRFDEAVLELNNDIIVVAAHILAELKAA